MRRLVDGMAGWLAYYQSRGTGRHYDEHLLYEHIQEIAEGRKWHCSQQHPLAGPVRRGARSTVDFVFSRRAGEARSRAGLLFVEVKYLRGDNPSQDLAELRKDIDKLRPLLAAGLMNNRRVIHCGPPAKFLLIFAQEAALRAVAGCRSRTNPKIAQMLRTAATGNRRNVYRASLETYLRTELEWVALAIGAPRWPR